MVSQETIDKLIKLRENMMDESALIQKQIHDLMVQQGQLSKKYQQEAHRLIDDNDFDKAEKIAERKIDELGLEFHGDSKVDYTGITYITVDGFGNKDKVVVGFFEINNEP